MADAMDGRSGGTFENPAHPADYTPRRDTSHVPGFEDGGHDAPGTDAFEADGGFSPLGYQGWAGHFERNTLLSATGVDHDSDDLS